MQLSEFGLAVVYDCRSFHYHTAQAYLTPLCLRLYFHRKSVKEREKQRANEQQNGAAAFVYLFFAFGENGTRRYDITDKCVHKQYNHFEFFDMFYTHKARVRVSRGACTLYGVRI